MARFISNTVYCEGGAEEIKKIKEMILKALELEYRKEFDKHYSKQSKELNLFEQLIPTPKGLSNGIDLGHRSYWSILPILGLSIEDLREKLYVYLNEDNTRREKDFYDEWSEYGKLETACHRKEKFGYYSEYEFRCKEWGTYDYWKLKLLCDSDNLIIFSMQTERWVPDKFLLYLSSSFPKVKITDYSHVWPCSSETVCSVYEDGSKSERTLSTGDEEISEKRKPIYEASSLRTAENGGSMVKYPRSADSIITALNVGPHRYKPATWFKTKPNKEESVTSGLGVVYTNYFGRCYGIASENETIHENIDDLILKLSKGEGLPESYADHQLDCPWTEIRECRVKEGSDNLFLVYKIKNNKLILIFIRKDYTDVLFKHDWYKACIETAQIRERTKRVFEKEL